jgi:integrase
MSVLFQHAMRYGWATANPIRLVRQSAMPLQEEIVLVPVEIAVLLSELRVPFYTLLLLVSVTGLRRGELFGLRWEDVDFEQAEIRVSAVRRRTGRRVSEDTGIPLKRTANQQRDARRRRLDLSEPSLWLIGPFSGC